MVEDEPCRLGFCKPSSVMEVEQICDDVDAKLNEKVYNNSDHFTSKTEAAFGFVVNDYVNPEENVEPAADMHANVVDVSN